MKKDAFIMAMMLTAPMTIGPMASGVAYAQQDEDKREIVVTGRSLKETGDALQACLDRGCPPDEDIKLTLAHAENQFVEGSYKDSRTTILKSLSRNKKHKEDFPIEVSDLLRANGNVAAHLGEADSYRLSVLDMRNIIKKALPENDYRVMGAELEVADSRLKLGYPEEALEKYRSVEKQALEQKKPFVAATAKLRELSLLVQIAQTTREDSRAKMASEALDGYIAKPTPGAEQYAFVAKVLKSRLDRAGGKTETTQELIRAYAALGATGRPILIKANPIVRNDEAGARASAGGSDLNRIGATGVNNRWVDIGFWITPSGRVEDPEILRNEGDVDWVKPVMTSIKSRIYTPTSGKDGDISPGFYAVERYTLTSNWTSDGTGSRFRKRNAATKIEQIDLSEDQ